MTPWLRFKVTVSGEQGPLMSIDQVLPLCLWPEARALQEKAWALVRIHEMTTEGIARIDIAKAVGRSPGWVKEKQKELGLV